MTIKRVLMLAGLAVVAASVCGGVARAADAGGDNLQLMRPVVGKHARGDASNQSVLSGARGSGSYVRNTAPRAQALDMAQPEWSYKLNPYPVWNLPSRSTGAPSRLSREEQLRLASPQLRWRQSDIP